MSNLALAVVEQFDLPANEQRHFPTVHYRGAAWDLTHLSAFGFPYDIGEGQPLLVIVVFSCHCFSREATKDEIESNSIPPADWYVDAKEKRVLDEARYRLSRKYLPTLIQELGTRAITKAYDRHGPRENFVAMEIEDENGRIVWYSVFFEMKKEKKRRLILRVQSAYTRDALTKREQEAKQVKLRTLIKATFEGRIIKS